MPIALTPSARRAARQLLKTSTPPAACVRQPITDPILLLVDDDLAVLESIRRVLALEGWRVITARSGEEALLRLQENWPDLIITDLCMSSVSGWDLLFHHRLEYPQLPIFVVSALPPKASGGAERFATEYFQKPLRMEALLEAVRHHLGISSSARVQP